MPYIGLFTEEKVQRAIERAGQKLNEGESGLVFHLDDKGSVSLAVVKRFGECISVEGSVAYDLSNKDLSAEAELVWRWK